MPPASSIPAVVTSSPSSIPSVESTFFIWSVSSSVPTTSPVARLDWSWPMTVELWSVISTTFAKFGPSSTTRPASAPPSAITTSPAAMPSSLPLLIVTTRRNSDDSRAMTSAATVLYSNGVLQLEQARQDVVLALDLPGPVVLDRAAARSPGGASSLSPWRRSISPIDGHDPGDARGDARDAP
jgi:hypothetical protein